VAAPRATVAERKRGNVQPSRGATHCPVFSALLTRNNGKFSPDRGGRISQVLAQTCLRAVVQKAFIAFPVPAEGCARTNLACPAVSPQSDKCDWLRPKSPPEPGRMGRAGSMRLYCFLRSYGPLFFLSFLSQKGDIKSVPYTENSEHSTLSRLILWTKAVRSSAFRRVKRSSGAAGSFSLTSEFQRPAGLS
jgi:hypothetical protein